MSKEIDFSIIADIGNGIIREYLLKDKDALGLFINDIPPIECIYVLAVGDDPNNIVATKDISKIRNIIIDIAVNSKEKHHYFLHMVESWEEASKVLRDINESTVLTYNICDSSKKAKEDISNLDLAHLDQLLTYVETKGFKAPF